MKNKIKLHKLEFHYLGAMFLCGIALCRYGGGTFLFPGGKMLYLDNTINTINIMEAVGVIFVLVALGLLVLQILMIAKFFQIASDVNAIKSWLTEQPKTKLTSLPQSMDAVLAGDTVEGSTTKNENECEYIQERETITFNDGLSGKIQKRFGEWWIYTDRGNQSFADKEMAIRRLHKDLIEQQK